MRIYKERYAARCGIPVINIIITGFLKRLSLPSHEPNKVFLAPAVYLEPLAGNEGREVGGEKEDDAGHIVGDTQAA